MPAGLAEQWAAVQDPRAGHLPGGDDAGESGVDAAGVAHGGEAGVEGLATVLEHVRSELRDRHAVRHAGLDWAGEPEVNVRVDETGRECQPGAVEDVRAGRWAAAHLHDAAVLDEDCLAGSWIASCAVHDRGTGQPHGFLLPQALALAAAQVFRSGPTALTCSRAQFPGMYDMGISVTVVIRIWAGSAPARTAASVAWFLASAMQASRLLVA